MECWKLWREGFLLGIPPTIFFSKMGGSESKEEVIISQAGNSGGATATKNDTGYSLMEIIGVVVAGFIIVAIGAY